MADEILNVRLSDVQKKQLLRRSALLTAKFGRRVTMSDMLRDALDQLVSAPLDDQNENGRRKEIKFVPLPPVEKALQRAHQNSGKPVGEIVNELLVEALEVAL